MSGPIPQAVAEAAHRHALHAEASARGMSVGHLIAERARNVSASKHGATKADTLAGQTWRAMHMRVRTLLVMLEAHDAQGDPRTVAMQPWGQFSAADQCRIGAAAREISRELTRAEYLR